MVDLPIKNGDFPMLCDSLPKGNPKIWIPGPEAVSNVEQKSHI